MPSPPKRRGRPPRAGGPADHRIELRVTGETYTTWHTAATREGLTLSDWLRAAAELALARGATR